MGIITLLISISITIALLFLAIFIWSLRSGQFDDTTTPAMRMIFDERKSQADQRGSMHSLKPQKAVSKPDPDKNQSSI